MPLSHLTLTVSHLPTSTSFFLSCLQPLGYKFIGRHDEYIGFGSKADEPADFWLAQEQPGTPAGAAHIAFPAPSKEAVNTFFISALKAGGKIHGEPKVRDAETGYFSAAVIDFDGNSIEAAYRPPDHGSSSNSNSDIVSMRGGPSALQTSIVKNGTVVSRARSTKTESVMQRDRAVHAIENIPASRVQMLYDQQQQQQTIYQSYTTQTQSNSSSNNNSLSAKTIIGTLLGATAGAAIAYAMIKGDSSSSSTSAPTTNSQASIPEPIPMQARSQYIQQQLPPPQQQQSQPQQMSMSLPMLMPMLGPAPGSAPAAFQEQQPIYRALEAPPTAAARSTFTANDAISAYTRSSASSKNKSPRADTIYEDTEYYPSIEGAPQVINGGSVYSQEPTTMSNGGGASNGIRRTSNGSVYATRELPIRAIEYTSGMSVTSQSQSSSTSSQKIRAKSYPCDPSTFISSYAEQQQQQGHIIGEAESDFSSISTIKPAKSSTSTSHRSSTSSSHTRSEKKYHHSGASSYHQSSTSSHRSSKSGSKHHSHHSHHRYAEDEMEEPVAPTVYSTSSSRMTAHKISLPESKPGSTYSVPYSSSSSSKRSSKSASNAGAGSRYSPNEIPLPESAAPSTVFLDAVAAEDSDNIITPDDSISQVGVNIVHNNETKSSSGRSHRSRSGPSSTPSTTSSRREKESKFDLPLKPSDSISQVSSNMHAKSRVSERSDRTVKAGSKVHSVKSGSRH